MYHLFIYHLPFMYHLAILPFETKLTQWFNEQINDKIVNGQIENVFMNILITGSNGQLGNEMRVLSEAHTKHRYFFTDVAELDICDRSAVSAFVAANGVDLIVNCAAYTNVDKAEEDEVTAMRINSEALGVLGSQGVRVIHISTDYIFSGNACVPYREIDPAAPNTVYGRTKYEGEKQLLATCPEAVILRY